LKNADLLTYRWVESSSGPPRKYFSLTEKGAAFYKELEQTWNEMASSVATVTRPNGKPNAVVTGESIEVHPPSPESPL
jgi:PadR family transcriptional regulator PadR